MGEIAYGQGLLRAEGLDMEKIRRYLEWSVIFTLWVSGAVLLWELWKYQRTLPDPIGSCIEFAVMFAATFYVLILFPIKHCVGWFLCRIWVSDMSQHSFGNPDGAKS